MEITYNEDYIIDSALEVQPGCFNISEANVAFKFYWDGYTYFHTTGGVSIKVASTYDEFLSWCKKG